MVDQPAAAGLDVGAGEGRPLRICLAASGGGHVRQLLDLQPVWSKSDYFFVTEDTALGRSLQDEHRTYFLPHFAWGQLKRGAPLRVLGTAISSLVRSARILFRERPDVVISTGAGAVIFAVLWGKLSGAHVIVIESFARFDRPSLFGRLAAPLANDLVVQSSKLKAHYPRAHVFDPLKIVQSEPPPKEALLFATVGATLPFDRLVQTVDDAHRKGLITERIVLQSGEGGRRPEGMETHETLPFGDVQLLLEKASIVVCHGGTGSLITALRRGCHVIAVPRLAELGEHYDNHQAEITEAFRQRGLIQVANTADEFSEAIANARSRERVMATTEPTALIEFVVRRLNAIGAEKRRPRTST